MFRAPVVFLVQNNRYAISVPLEKQTAAPTLAYKGVGYGVPSEQVDGNDLVAMLSVLDKAVARARDGEGPTLVEAHTYRIDAHTNADDATRYRTDDEVSQWRAADPLPRLEAYLRDKGNLGDAEVEAATTEAEEFAVEVRARMNQEPVVDPLHLFEHVYAEPTQQLTAQHGFLTAELAEQEN